jgi:hypothetical protein
VETRPQSFGEETLYGLSSFGMIRVIRRGARPKDAGMEVLKRIKANAVEKRLLNGKGTPNSCVNFHILNGRREYSGRDYVRGIQRPVCYPR